MPRVRSAGDASYFERYPDVSLEELPGMHRAVLNRLHGGRYTAPEVGSDPYRVRGSSQRNVFQMLMHLLRRSTCLRRSDRCRQDVVASSPHSSQQIYLCSCSSTDRWARRREQTHPSVIQNAGSGQKTASAIPMITAILRRHLRRSSLLNASRTRPSQRQGSGCCAVSQIAILAAPGRFRPSGSRERWSNLGAGPHAACVV